MKDELPTYTEMVEMELHVQLVFPDFMITRVPGGWLYTTRMCDVSAVVFVPIAQDNYGSML